MSTTRMGRPPAGPGGMKVEDLPRVTIRLEPEILQRARDHARQAGKPLWRLVQDLLRDHLESQRRRDAGPPGRPTQSAPPTAQLRQLALTRPEIELLRSALQWRTSSEPADQEQQALRDLLERACAFGEQLFRVGLNRARRRPRGPTSIPSWELSLEDCRRLRRAVRQFLAAGRERTESEIRTCLYGKSLPEIEQERHAQRIHKEVRVANGKLRAVLKKIPWR